jgi:hypothetical protein
MKTETPPMTMTSLPPTTVPLTLDELLSKLRAVERTAVMNHLAACRAESDPQRGTLWERLLCALLTLAPKLPRFGSRACAQFFIPDGRYKLQVFALKDSGRGEFHVYCCDALRAARAVGLIGQAASAIVGVAGAETLRCGGGGGGPVTLGASALAIEMLDGGKVSEPEAHLRPMLGWGRRVMHVTLPVSASEAQIAAVESLCALSATHWAAAAPPAN